jgi:hypothetical protein
MPCLIKLEKQILMPANAMPAGIATVSAFARPWYLKNNPADLNTILLTGV